MSPQTPSSNIFEFKILKTVSKDFWLTNVVQFFDGMAYFSMITVFVLYLTDYCSFNDADAALWVGLYTLFISAFVFAVGSICDIIGIRRTYLIGFIILIAGRLIMGFGRTSAQPWTPEGWPS